MVPTERGTLVTAPNSYVSSIEIPSALIATAPTAKGTLTTKPSSPV